MNTWTESWLTGELLKKEYDVGRRVYVGLEFREYLYLDGALLPGIQFDGCWMDGTFKKADLNGAVFKNCCIKTISFDNANLRGASFESSEIDATTWEGADLSDANFDGATAYGSHLDPRESSDSGSE